MISGVWKVPSNSVSVTLKILLVPVITLPPPMGIWFVGMQLSRYRIFTIGSLGATTW